MPSNSNRDPLQGSRLQRDSGIRSSRLRVAVVGCGIGLRHAASFARLNEHFELCAVCDTDPGRARAAAAAGGGVEVVESYETLLGRSDLDLLSLCTPPYLHYSQITRAVEAGFHVICEKPLVGSLEEMDILAAVGARVRKLIIPVFQMRFGSGLQKLKRLVQSGIAGRSYLTSIEVAWRRGSDYYRVPWRATWKGALGGCVLSHAVHACDMLLYINGPVSRVHAFAKTLVNPVELEDCAVASLEMSDGSLAALSVTLGSARELTRLRFCFENLAAESNVSPYDCSSDPWQFTGTSPEVDRRIEETLRQCIPGFEGYDAQFIDAWGMIHGGPGTSRFEDARNAIELASAIYHSASCSERVDLPLVRGHPAYRGTTLQATPPIRMTQDIIRAGFGREEEGNAG
ncbi:MAG: Gfo/Idh/MocA family oxidoreductase [Opitutaceae bacterium]|nr:Gfo/Idh/MocA family oxidoreductase [Opitutaceae bacterium]